MVTHNQEIVSLSFVFFSFLLPNLADNLVNSLSPSVVFDFALCVFGSCSLTLSYCLGNSISPAFILSFRNKTVI